MKEVAIIGAGISAASAVWRLRDHGQGVTVFEKARGPGGRMATRRHTQGEREYRFDHGARSFDVSDARFGRFVEAARQAGAVQHWASQGPQWWVGMPGMNALARFGLGDAPAHYGVRITAIERRDGQSWLISEEGERFGPFAAVLVTVPAPQVPPLLNEVHPRFSAAASDARYAPCWTVMLAFEDGTALGGVKSDLLQDQGMDWIGHDGDKPGRGDAATLVIQADPDWSTRHLEDAPEAVTARVSALLREATGLPEPVVATGHRWRYSSVIKGAGLTEPYDHDQCLGVAGDWISGGGVETAWLSGLMLADHFLGLSD